MKKIYSLIASAIVAVGFTACTQSDLLEGSAPDASLTSADNAIQFGTYLGKTGTTRAGAEGPITTDGANSTKKLGTEGYEFGVFAYYTGRYTYGGYQANTYSGESSKDGSADKVANFMYNQKVGLDASSNWTYAPLKYWPNEFAAGNVDDKDAQGSTANGYVSFFAYAPYVASASGDNGITAMTANSDQGDPKITYKLESGVDLLWGTAGTYADDKALESGANAGVTGNSSAGDNTYVKAILNGVTVNADLTKQKVNKQVNFLFKHALAAIGGGKDVGPGNGFQVKLDIDNSTNGEIPGSPSITGGSRQDFEESSTAYWRTKVTIKNITVTNDLDGDGNIGGDEVGLNKTGVLNLATGQWVGSNPGKVGQEIKLASSYTSEVAKLNPEIAEFKDEASYTTAKMSDYTTQYLDYFAKNLDGTFPGVTESPQNVYDSATQSPFMLIPGQAPKLKITVEYVVRQYDAALNQKYTEVNNKISKIVQFPTIEMNKYYSLLMHLGLTSVKFTATVSSWDQGHIGTAGGGSSADSDDVYLPINVVTVP